MTELEQLRFENSLLKQRLIDLERELEFFKTHPVFVQGLKGERLIAELTGGALTSFAQSHDISLPNKVSIEVKYSKLNTPVNVIDPRFHSEFLGKYGLES